jgi:hypothetical protein
MKVWQSLWLARIGFIGALGFLCYGLLQTFTLDGLICQGVNAHLGKVERNKSIASTLNFVNISFWPVKILQEPTCGCQLTKEIVLTLQPFRSASLSIPYRIDPKEHGERKRTVRLYMTRGNEMRKLEGITSFIVD